MIYLVKPSTLYKDTFMEGLKEFHNEGRNLKYNAEELNDNFNAFIQSLWNKENEKKLEEGRVKESVFWLIDGHEFIGRVSLRHELNEELLKLGGHVGYEIRPTKRRKGYGKRILEFALKEAKKINLDKVLVTCDAYNIGSKKIIEHNGGMIENELFSDVDNVSRLRYWIDLN